MMLAHGSLVPLLLALGAWGLANIVGVASLAMSFSRLRHTGFVLASALVAGILGVVMSIATGLPHEGLHWVYLASWSPLVLGGISLVRWSTRRA